jgi:DNA-binding LacI/PurR family transcriptional regulator
LSDEDASTLRAAEIPVVDSVLDPDQELLVGLDQYEIGRLQARHLAERGHVVLGFAAIDDPRERPFCRPRMEGVQQVCRELDLPAPVVATMTYSVPTASAALSTWRTAGTPVTAVAAYNDLLALAVLGASSAAGLRVPDDLALVGVDDLPAAALAVPALSTIALDLSIPAQKLAARVTGMIDADLPAPAEGGGRVFRLIQRASS